MWLMMFYSFISFFFFLDFSSRNGRLAVGMWIKENSFDLISESIFMLCTRTLAPFDVIYLPSHKIPFWPFVRSKEKTSLKSSMTSSSPPSLSLFKKINTKIYYLWFHPFLTVCRYSKNIIDRVRAHETTKMSSSPLTQPTKYIIKRFKNKTRRNKNIDNAYIWNATDVSPIPDAARVSFIVTVIVHFIEKKSPKTQTIKL